MKKKVISIILCILCILTLFPTTVFADDDAMNLGERAGADSIGIRTSFHYGHQLHYTNIGDWNYPLFCLEYGTESPSSSYLHAKREGASSKAIEAARWIFAGYYLEHGNSINWLDMAYCQKKVWAIMGDNSSWDFSSSGYNSWCENAERNMRSLNTYPSFDGKEIGCFSAGETYQIMDTNGVLCDYPPFEKEVVSGVKIVHHTNENRLFIVIDKNCKAKSFYLSPKTYFKDKTGLDDELLLYYPYGSNSLQKLMYSAYYDPIDLAFSGDIVSRGDLELIKQSEDGNVEGFTFKLTELNTNKTYTLKTDANGKAKITGLSGNSYCKLEEILDPNGIYVDKGVKDVFIFAGESRTFTFTNTIKKGNIYVDKVDSKTGDKIEANDGEFMCQEWSKSSNSYVDLKPLEWNSELKQYEATNLVCTEDNECRFRVVELKAPTGYVPCESPYLFKINRDNQNVYAHSKDGVYQYENEPQMVKLQLLKEGEALTGFEKENTEYGELFKPTYASKMLEGAVYEIRAKENIVSNGVIKYTAGEVVDTITTTSEGAISQELYPGVYEYYEIKAPYGYVLDDTVYEIELKYNPDESNVYTVTVGALNERQKVELSLIKAFEENIYYENPDAYKDVLFGVYSKDDIEINNELIVEKDSAVDYITIDEALNGSGNADLPIGYEWYVKELKTAKGWLTDDNLYEFTTEADTDLPIIEISVNNGEPIVNEVITGTIKGLKKSDDGKALQGATIGLFKASETEFNKSTALMTVVSDNNGFFIFNNVPYGAYIIKELESPTGFEIDNNEYKVEITEPEQIIELVITDKKIVTVPLKPTISPYTGNDISITPLLFCAAAWLTVLSGIVIAKKHKKQESR